MAAPTEYSTVSNSSYASITVSKTNVNSSAMKQLLEEELDRVIIWLDQFELSKSRKVLSRDFSDGGNQIM